MACERGANHPSTSFSIGAPTTFHSCLMTAPATKDENSPKSPGRALDSSLTPFPRNLEILPAFSMTLLADRFEM